MLETRGLQGLDGGDVGLELGPTTHSPNRSPFERGTEIFDGETGLQNLPFLSPETDTETTRSGRKPALRGKNAKTPKEVRYLKTGWWAHQGSNLGPDD